MTENEQNIQNLEVHIGNEIQSLYRVFRERKPEGGFGGVFRKIRRQMPLYTYKGREVKIGTIIDLYEWDLLTPEHLLGMYILIQKRMIISAHPQFSSAHRIAVQWIVETAKARMMKANK